jgi:hypothetical protein
MAAINRYRKPRELNKTRDLQSQTSRDLAKMPSISTTLLATANALKYQALSLSLKPEY